ncbi:MAG: class I SAM-dependent methyltransferase [Gammaproteobacteria bacterium]|nr:class I SAM-dependent methyltransferase [Gammaproteobacteria bacterium]
MFEHYDRYDYFSCTNCKALFQHPMPTLEEINSFYPSDYSVFDQKAQVRKISPFKQAMFWCKHGYTQLKPSWLYKLLATLLSPLYTLDKPDYIENGKLLDVGCGNGRYLTTMRSLGWDVQGVELSENGLKVCQEAELRVHHGDLLSAKFPADTFDVITVRHVIEHIREPHPFMKELARILKPGGKLIIETPNSNALGRAFLGANWFANEVPRHLILFSPDNLIRLAKEYGLKKASLRLDSTPKIFLNSIDYIIDNKNKPSNKVRWKRSLSRLYIWLARYTKRGDVIHSVFRK